MIWSSFKRYGIIDRNHQIYIRACMTFGRLTCGNFDRSWLKSPATEGTRRELPVNGLKRMSLAGSGRWCNNPGWTKFRYEVDFDSRGGTPARLALMPARFLALYEAVFQQPPVKYRAHRVPAHPYSMRVRRSSEPVFLRFLVDFNCDSIGRK